MRTRLILAAVATVAAFAILMGCHGRMTRGHYGTGYHGSRFITITTTTTIIGATMIITIMAATTDTIIDIAERTVSAPCWSIQTCGR